MSKFEFMCSKDDISVVKIGNSIYYIDIIDKFDIIVYNHLLIKQNIIVPEFWIAEVSRGEAALSTLIACSKAYENGFNAGLSTKSKKCFKDFVQKLTQIILQPQYAEKFIKLFWIELRPFSVVKSLIGKMILNENILHSTPEASRIILDRFIIRSKFENDYEFSDKAFRIADSLVEANFDPTNEMLYVLDIKDSNVPMLIQNIQKLVDRRQNARTNRL